MGRVQWYDDGFFKLLFRCFFFLTVIYKFLCVSFICGDIELCTHVRLVRIRSLVIYLHLYNFFKLVSNAADVYGETYLLFLSNAYLHQTLWRRLHSSSALYSAGFFFLSLLHQRIMDIFQADQTLFFKSYFNNNFYCIFTTTYADQLRRDTRERQFRVVTRLTRFAWNSP